MMLGMMLSLAVVVVFIKVWLDKEDRPRENVAVSLWFIAIAYLIYRVLTVGLGNDEVHYLASSYTLAHHGGDPQVREWLHGTGFGSGCMMRMRTWLLQPYLALGLSASATVMLGRWTMALAALVCSVIVGNVAQRFTRHRAASVYASALSLFAFAATLPMVCLRPEYFSLLFIALGLWIMIRQPSRLGFPARMLISALLLSLAAATSLRQVPIAIVLLVGQVGEAKAGTRTRALLWSVIGAAIGAAPTLLTASVREIFLTNVSLLQENGWTDMLGMVSPPYAYILFGLCGAGVLVRERFSDSYSATIVLAWLAAALAAVLLPYQTQFGTGPLMLLGCILAGVFISRLKVPKWSSGDLPWGSIVMAGLVFVVLFAPIVGLVKVSAWREDAAMLRSQLRLIDWLGEISRGEPVMCVDANHPIRSGNAWGMWNAYLYSYVYNRDTNRLLCPRHGEILSSDEVPVIQWDPWSFNSGYPNILLHAVNRQLIPESEIDGIASSLAEHYRLVKWSGPVHYMFGKRFLVRRDIDLDNRVEELDDSTILGWRDAR